MGRAEPQYKEGESWTIIAALSSESIRQSVKVAQCRCGRGGMRALLPSFFHSDYALPIG